VVFCPADHGYTSLHKAFAWPTGIDTNCFAFNQTNAGEIELLPNVGQLPFEGHESGGTLSLNVTNPQSYRLPHLAGNLHIHAVRPEVKFVSVVIRPTVKKENPCTS